MLTLTLKDHPHVPLEAEVLSPDRLAGLPLDGIRALPVHLGKRKCRLDDFFDLAGEAGDELELGGDLMKVKWIGLGMSRGGFRVAGDPALELRGGIKGVVTEVRRAAQDWHGEARGRGL